MIEDKLGKNKYKPDSKTHLEVCQKDCRECQERSCEVVCPAKVYEFDTASGEMKVNYENCLECGACRIACDKQSLRWKYPDAGYGITFKQG